MRHAMYVHTYYGESDVPESTGKENVPTVTFRGNGSKNGIDRTTANNRTSAARKNVKGAINAGEKLRSRPQQDNPQRPIIRIRIIGTHEPRRDQDLLGNDNYLGSVDGVTYVHLT